MTQQAVTALYVPSSRPDRFDKAATSGADIVILDLEDAVAPADKASARGNVVDWLATRPVDVGVSGRPGVAVQVRINAPGTPDGAADIAALPPSVALRLPKVESITGLDAVGQRDLHALVETALGLEQAFAIASDPRVMSIALGEADLAADLGTTDEAALAWARARLVVAARAAGLRAPMMSVFPRISDLDGLARSCAEGRALGMRGRTAIHPSQLEVIRQSFAPTERELTWAERVLAAVDAAGGGVAVLDDGAMVDEAMARRARSLLDRSVG